MFIQASVSVKRLGSYLKGEELDPNAVQWESDPARGKLRDGFAMADSWGFIRLE